MANEEIKMIQWTGNNLKDVISFTGRSPKFGEWFKSWDEFEEYVHSHNDILKLFCEDGSHYEVPKGAWIIRTPDGYNVASRSLYVPIEKPRFDLKKEVESYYYEHFDMLHNSELSTMQIVSEIARHFYDKGCRHTAAMFDDIEHKRQILNKS